MTWKFSGISTWMRDKRDHKANSHEDAWRHAGGDMFDSMFAPMFDPMFVIKMSLGGEESACLEADVKWQVLGNKS